MSPTPERDHVVPAGAATVTELLAMLLQKQQRTNELLSMLVSGLGQAKKQPMPEEKASREVLDEVIRSMSTPVEEIDP